MSVSLQKGQKVSLSKEHAGLSRMMVGLGWDEAQKAKGGFFAPKPKPIDCDASALLLKNGRLCDKSDIVYFGNLGHKTGALQQMGDNLPAEYDRIVIVVNIYQAVQRKQHFGMIQNAFIRLIDQRNNGEMCKYNLTEDYSGMTAMIFGEIYRHNGEWKFSAVGQGTTDPGLGELANRYI